MTLQEEEKQLIEEITFFNKAVSWWTKEFNSTNRELCKMERNHFINTTSEHMDALVEKLKYLAGKAKIEQKTADEIDKKLYKLRLRKELFLIQGDFSDSKRKKI